MSVTVSAAKIATLRALAEAVLEDVREGIEGVPPGTLRVVRVRARVADPILARAVLAMLPLLDQSSAKHRSPDCKPDTCIKCAQDVAHRTLEAL